METKVPAGFVVMKRPAAVCKKPAKRNEEKEDEKNENEEEEQEEEAEEHDKQPGEEEDEEEEVEDNEDEEVEEEVEEDNEDEEENQEEEENEEEEAEEEEENDENEQEEGKQDKEKEHEKPIEKCLRTRVVMKRPASEVDGGPILVQEVCFREAYTGKNIRCYILAKVEGKLTQLVQMTAKETPEYKSLMEMMFEEASMRTAKGFTFVNLRTWASTRKTVLLGSAGEPFKIYHQLGQAQPHPKET